MKKKLVKRAWSAARLAGGGQNKRPAAAGMLLAVVAVLWSSSMSAAPPAPLAPSIALNAGGLAVSGLTPGVPAVVFGIIRETKGGVAGYARHNYVLWSVDALGTARVNHVPLTPVSVWCVVDLRTGAYAMTAPSGYTIRRPSLPTNALRAAPNAQLNSLRLKRDFVEVLWVRPGLGVWEGSIGDGGESDTDHTVDGHVSIAPEQMQAIGGSPPPPNYYLPNDTFIIVDPDTMELFTLPVAQ